MPFSQSTPSQGATDMSRPRKGRPRDVLLYIDYCLDPRRPCPYDVCGGEAEARRVLPAAEAALYASQERLRYAQGAVRTQKAVVAALALADEFPVDILR